MFRYAKGRVRELENTNKVLKRLAYCNGMKTGYTEAAGHCLIASGARPGRDIIVLATANLACGRTRRRSCPGASGCSERGVRLRTAGRVRAEQGRGNQRGIPDRIARAFGRDVFGTFSRRSWSVQIRGLGRGEAGRVHFPEGSALRWSGSHEAWRERHGRVRFAKGSSLGCLGGLAGGKESDGEQTGGDFGDHFS